jgi:hypothetical protein
VDEITKSSTFLCINRTVRCPVGGLGNCRILELGAHHTPL